ncbi:AAA-like domain-containing protein [Scytonema sp. PCC 10023]|uniref:AAA-like domain-containing protein n=1 Tax=Scytonema sp. PCC 10023 TaxID=1680591 RepID=UPI0039C5D6CE
MEELLEAVEQILEDKPLGSIQQFVLYQSWLGKTYTEMAQGSGYGSDYIKEVGSQLWQDLSDALGERVTKKNLHLVLTKFQQDWMSQDNSEPQRELRAGSSAQRGFLDLVSVSKLDFPSGPVPLSSPFYINRPPLEELVYAEIMQPGCLLRIKAPRKMGKSSLLNRIIAHAKVQGYKTVSLDFQEADEAIFASLDKFLRWFCINVSRQLNLAPNLDDYWDAEMGSKVSCKFYFEGYLLEQIDSPIVLALNEVHRVFEHPNIAQDFLPMLRFWHEVAKQDRTWQKVRLVVVHTTEIYIPLKLNQSPFNVGLTVPLPPFTIAQVQNLAIEYGIDWAASSEGAQRLAALQTMIGGHPYLINLALYHLCQEEMTLLELLQTASTPSGIYSQHLRELLTLLQADPQLMSAMQEVVMADESVQFDAGAPRGAALSAIAAYKLESMGLVQLDGNQARASCELYRLYFSQQLLRQNDDHASANLLKEQQQSNDISEADALSQFVHLHYFSQYLETQWQQWLTEATMLSVIVCEIDYFKFYTDTHGYTAGNSSLQRIASTIREGIKYKATLVSHYEGTKFAAVLPQTPGDIAVDISENIREGVEQLAIARASSVLYSEQEGQTRLANPEATLALRVSEGTNSARQRAIAQAQFQFDGFPAPVLTVSLGIATAIPNHENSPVMLMAAAEEALFQAKRKGRNCVALNSVLSEDN